MTARQNSNPELRFKTVAQSGKSKSTQRERKSTKSRSESAALQIDLLYVIRNPATLGTRSQPNFSTTRRAINEIIYSLESRKLSLQNGVSFIHIWLELLL